MSKQIYYFTSYIMSEECIPYKKIKIKTFFLLFSVCLVLFSCGNNKQDKEQEDDMRGGEEMQDMMQEQGQGMMEGEGMDRGMMQDEMMSEEMRKAMMSKRMGPEMMEDMMVIRNLLMQHEKIDRRVENMDNGVKTRTTSDDPQIAAAIQKHVRQMHKRIKEKEPIRQMDPLFREIFQHADKINMLIKDIENGVVVIETSDDPQVIKLIRQHANRAVSEFVDRGMQRAMEPTPLPEGYEENKKK